MVAALSIRVGILGFLLSSAFALHPVDRRQIGGVESTGSLRDNLLKSFQAIRAKARPKSFTEVQAILQLISKTTPIGVNKFLHKAEKLIELGFLSGDLSSRVATLKKGSSTSTNSSNLLPNKSIYPSKISSDAPYSVPEAELRSAIVVPPTFSNGVKPPTILIPGTGSTAYLFFAPNYIKLLSNVPYADPVWVNIPHHMLGDAQVNAEYVAYAINYIASLTKRNVSVISISQGGPSTQWALKYWPSTRSVVSNLIALSPDFHGTTEAYLLCGLAADLTCTPAIDQQEYKSNFVKTLRSNGGDSAYVPTTTIFSETDDIVQPQKGFDASAFLLDKRNVGVSNTDIQSICSGLSAAGGNIDHVGTLYNAMAFALAVDALTHPGPAELARLDVSKICEEPAAPGLTVADVLDSESVLIDVIIAVLLYQGKSGIEPPIASYAIGH